MITTPDNILELAANEVFVFGSNLGGRHGAGAAKFALNKFGAVYGSGEGLQGRSYAFPTLGYGLEKLKREGLKDSAVRLFVCAREHPELTFLVTKVGCGLAGFSEEEMIPLFRDAPENCVLPDGWRSPDLDLVGK